MSRNTLLDPVIGIAAVALALVPATLVAQEAADAVQAAPDAAVADGSAPSDAGEAPLEEAPATVAVDAPQDAAQEAAPEAEDGGNRFMQEIVVTAQKREENLQDVPISVQAFSADALDARGIEEPKALQLSTPGLQYNVFAGYSLIYIRGVGTDAFIPSADASVATYIDNVYFPFGHSLASALGSIERVEVLKGPQGTLFGRNSTGGAINIVTKQPGPEFESSVLASRESYDKANFRAYVNIPLADTLAFSVSGLSYSEDQYYDLSAANPRTGLPEETSRAFSVKGSWFPTDDLTATVGFTHMNTRGGNSMSLPVADPKPAGVALGVRAAPDYQTGEDAPVYVDTVANVITGDIKYSTPWLDLRFIGGHQDIDSPALADYDGSDQPLTTFEALGQFAKVKTGELQFLSNDESWGNGWLTWIGGIYYIDSSAGYDPLLFTAAPGLLQFLDNPDPSIPIIGPILDGISSPLIAGLGTISDAAGVPLDSLLDGGVTLNLQGVLDTKSTAYFAQTTLNFTDALALTLGGRYQTETRKLAKSTTRLVLNPEDPETVLPALDFGTRKKDTSNFSPKVVLDYKFGDASMAYASWSKGFKSGTYNIIAIYAPTQYIKPEEVTAYEVGYKGDLLDGALRFNTAAFFNKIQNLQVQTISLTSGGAVRFETAGSAEIKGADFDLTWQVFPDALPGFVLTAGGAYLHGRYTSYREGSGFDQTTGLFFDGTIFPSQDFTGNKMVRTPKWSGNTGLSYTYDIGSGTLEVAGDVYFNDGSYFSAQNTPTSRERSYHLFNARASYIYNPWNLRVSVFGKNLNDAEYHYVISELDFGTAKLLAPPSTYGMKVQWEF